LSNSGSPPAKPRVYSGLIKPSFALENNSRGLIDSFPDNSLAGVPCSEENVGEALIPAMTGDNVYEDDEKVIYLLNVDNFEDTTNRP
jgi:hypothetical protein